MTESHTTYAVIGGGIVGTSIAYHLSERTDESITVFEQNAIGSETTYKSMAMYGLYGDETQYQMKRYGLRLYNEFFESPRAHPRYNLAGRLRVATTDTGAETLKKSVHGEPGSTMLTGIHHDLLEYIDSDELTEVLLLPHLATANITGAVFRPRVGFMAPQELAHEFAARCRDNGVAFDTGTRISGIEITNGKATGVATAEGTTTADHVICAAGPWNIKLTEDAGVTLPVRHTLAPILKLQSDEFADYSLPVIDHLESPYSIYRQRSRDPKAMYIGYSPAKDPEDVNSFLDRYDIFDPDTMGESIPESIRSGMLDTAQTLMPSLVSADIVDEWVGIRSVTPDHNPIIGWTELPGLSIAAFHTSGIQLAPKVGDIIAKQLIDNDPTEFYDALSITRFDGYTDNHEPTTCTDQ